MLLNAHPEVCTVGELKITSLGDVERYRCSCGKRILECTFWNSITNEMAARGFNFNISNPGTDIRSGASPYILRLLKPLYRRPIFEKFRDIALQLSPIWREQYPRIQRANTALIESILSLSNKKLVVDSSKIGIRLKYLMRNPTLDIKVIRLIRDGRAVSLTYMDPANFADAQNRELRDGGLGGDRSAERLSMEQAAREWRRSNEEAETLLRGVDRKRWVGIHYEELCRQPEDTLKKIFEFLEVSTDPINLNFRSVEHHIVGNGMRLDDSSQIKVDDRWRSQLTKSQIAVFTHLAGKMNKALGYA